MRKIIVAIDGLNYKPSVTEFALSTAIHINAHLVGIFLHDRTYHSYKIYDTNTGMLMSKEHIEKGEAHDKQLRKNAVEQFIAACNLKKVAHSVREDKNIALSELIRESLYADLLVINSGEQFNDYPTSRPSRFMTELLESVHCPIILSPDEIQPVTKAVLLYDGSLSSVAAIKRYCDFAPQYSIMQTNIEVLTVKKAGESLHLKDNKLIKEYLKRHFPKAIYTVVSGEANLKIPAMLKKERSSTIVVLGAYQRGMLSRWLHTSMADILLSTIKLPLFIAHTK
jgi:nucleotide-binding universal stress UspA family protein